MKEEPTFPAKNISEATNSFLRFLGEMQQSEMLISYLEVSNKFIVENKAEARNNFFAIYDHAGNPTEIRNMLENQSDAFLNIEYYNIPLSSMIYVRSIDNFITYFKEILSEIVLVKPQILKSQESESLEFILSYDSLDELISAIATKKIEELFYKGIEEIEKFFKSRLKIDIFDTVDQKEKLNFLIKQRNLTVHNRRRISKEFAKQFSKEFPELENKIGEYLNFDFLYVNRINLYLYNFLAQKDEEISNKFKLEKIKINQR